MLRKSNRYVASMVTIVAALAVALVAWLAGLDLVSMTLGAGIVASAFVIIIGLWMAQADRARRADRRRQRRAMQALKQQSARTRRVVNAAERRLFSQLEALAWLRDELQLRRPLRATRGAAASPDALLELIRLIDLAQPESVLELGSGVSTVVIAARLKSAGRGRVVALEHDQRYAEATRTELVAQSLDDVATVVDAPLEEIRINGEAWQWYELGDRVPVSVDILFVDGPPGSVAPLARYPALPALRDRLVPGAQIFVDDGDRTDEKEMVRRWASEIEGLTVRQLSLAKGAFIATMPAA